MASASKKESTNKLLRSLLLSEKAGFPIERLSVEYRGLVGEPLPYKAFGFNTLELYLRSIPEVVTLRRNGDGSWQCMGQADESTQHIKSLVSRQKSNKRKVKPKRGARPKPMQFRSNPRTFRGPPAYRAPPSRPAAFPRPVFRRGPKPTNTGWGSNKPSGFNQQSSNNVRPSSSSSSSSSFRNNAPARAPEPAQQRTSNKPAAKPQQHQTQSFSSKNNNAHGNSKPASSGKWGAEPSSNTSGKRNTESTTNSGKWNSEHNTTSGKWNSEPATKETRNTAAPSQAPAHSHQTRPRIPSASSVIENPKPVLSGQSAFVSVVENTRSSSTSGEKKQSAAPRVLAPRFLKKMQKDMEEQHYKDIKKENKRRQHAQQQLVEHNNNQSKPELRITVTNDKVNDDPGIDQDNSLSPTREEWPRRTVEQTGNGDWHTSAVTERIIQSVPVINSAKTRSDSPVNHTFKEPARRATPPASPVTVAPSSEDEPLCKWFNKTLDNKHSGLWRSSLDTEYKKEFSTSLTDDVIHKMVTLKVLTVEKVFNQEIVYPNLKIEASNAAARKVVVNGAARLSRHNSSSSDTSSPIDLAMANMSLQQNTDKTTTSNTDNTTAPSPLPTTPVSSTPSPTTIKSPVMFGVNSDDVPDYSHLAVPLPEEEILEVYVSYIKNLQDFYVLIIDEEYSDRLFTLEEEMGRYYRYSRRNLQGAPAPGCMYAAELNKEWLRVMVDTVEGEHVRCFLVDHGDTEQVESSKLQPLAPQFLHVPFQAIPCKLEGTEDEPENAEATQKFCEVGLGQVLTAEILSKEDLQVEVILYEEEAVATVNDLCLMCI